MSLTLPFLFALSAPGLHGDALYAAGMAFVGLVVLVGVVALTRQGQRPYSATVFYLLLGVLASVGLHVAGVVQLDPLGDHVVFQRITEVALVVAVFGAGLSVEHRVRRYSRSLVVLLLVVVMPLTILAIAAYGMVAMGLPVGAAVLLGAVLAPTDPVLAGDLGLGPPGSELRGEPRFSLHTEAAANDGLASPFVLLGLFVAGRGGTGWLGRWVLLDLLYGVGVALIVGIGLGFLAAEVTERARARGLLSPGLDGFLAPAWAVIIYAAAQSIGTYGLLAVFLAGITFTRRDRGHQLNERFHHGSELTGRLFEMAILLLLGASLTLSGLGQPGVSGWLLAPLVIVVLRPALVWLVCLGGPLGSRGRLFLGFFGVRGVAAVYYATVVVSSHQLSPALTSRVVWTTLVCVSVSVLVHGVTAGPLSRHWLTEHVPAARSPERAGRAHRGAGPPPGPAARA
ncbi:MAG TPA: cation:proton antiporter [Solirubrobacteraceae bacterium]|nr:cation:proton antiporter [Solirubrobacteraceae bacterium]